MDQSPNQINGIEVGNQEIAESPRISDFNQDPRFEPAPVIKRWYQRGWGKVIIAGILFILVLLIIVIILVFYGANKMKENMVAGIDKTQLQLGENSAARKIAEKTDRPSFGNPKAKLVIVEFADFECPHCLKEFPEIREAINNNKEDVFFIYRQYPVISQNSPGLAKASLCANSQGKFWNLHDKLFLNQGKIQDADQLNNIIIQSGVDMDQFNKCVADEKYTKMISEDLKDAIDLGVRGTPTFFINGNKLEGPVTKEAWQQLIDKFKEMNKQL